MTDHTELIARLRKPNSQPWGTFVLDCRAAADALAARDAACGHQPNELVVKWLSAIQAVARAGVENFGSAITTDEIAALRAATFEVTE